MSSEYLTWLARNEKPEEKRELTPKERRANWWHYNKIYVFIAIAAVFLLTGLVREMRRSAQATPDCMISYVGAQTLPEDTVAVLQEQLAPLIGDLDGNGTSIVTINQYSFAPDAAISMDSNQQMTLLTHLATDVITILLLDDPEAFQAQFGALTLEEGDTPLCYAWTDCNVLTSLPLDDKTQELLSGLCIALPYRGVTHQATAAWEILTS